MGQHYSHVCSLIFKYMRIILFFLFSDDLRHRRVIQLSFKKNNKPQIFYIETETESERWKLKSLSHVRLMVHGILQARILEWVPFPFSMGSSKPRDWTQVIHTAGRFLTSWATGKPKNTGVGSLSLLQGIFPIQELNQALLYCRQILYQLSYPISKWSRSIVSDSLRPRGL